jgi:hypothetical protein
MGYQRATKRLRSYMKDTQDPDTSKVLICCIIFYAFERLQGNAAAATIHLNNGMSILKAQRVLSGPAAVEETVASNNDKLHRLSVMFVHLDIEATMQDLDRGPRLPVQKKMPEQSGWIEPPVSRRVAFATPQEFYEPWMFLCHHLWDFVHRYRAFRRTPTTQVPAHVIAEKSFLESELYRW